jgi:hypothetical protein
MALFHVLCEIISIIIAKFIPISLIFIETKFHDMCEPKSSILSQLLNG